MEENEATLVQVYPDTSETKGNPSTPGPLYLSPRQRRALMALLEHPRSREELDRIAGTSNSPDLVSRLRQRGILIVCEHVGHTDRDGVKGWHGVYKLPASERERLRGAL